MQSIEQVQKSLQERGLEASDVLLFIDFTKSNEYVSAFSRRHDAQYLLTSQYDHMQTHAL
jgi:hypothetical protein